jgi:phosphoserine phosphatase RsbU/P
MSCLEVWGGNAATDQDFNVHGIDGWIYSRPYHGAASGGDVHYVSMCGRGRIARFLLADVAGHGSGPSDLAVSLRKLMRRHINTPDQTRLARTLNRTFGNLSRKGVFATAAMLTYFAPTNQLITCLAGHMRPLWYRADQDRWELLSHASAADTGGPSGLPLGIIHPTEYRQFAVTLRPGDAIVIYTDAMIETGGPEPQSLGEEGLLTLANSLTPGDPAQIGRALIERVDHEFGLTDADRSDDLTVLVLSHNGAKPPPPTLSQSIRAMVSMLGI